MYSRTIVIFVSTVMLTGCTGANQNEHVSSPVEELKDMKKTYVVASPYSGRLFKDGKPVVNVKLIHELRWTQHDEEPMIRELQTDNDGYFEVDGFSVELELSPFQEFNGRSYIYAKGEEATGFENGPDYFMTISRGDLEEGAEFGDQPVGMRCELTSSSQGFDLNGAIGSTKCTWSNMYKSELFQ